MRFGDSFGTGHFFEGWWNVGELCRMITNNSEDRLPIYGFFGLSSCWQVSSYAPFGNL
jgi:hypothetical protein